MSMNEVYSGSPDAMHERTLLESLLHYLSIILRYRWLILIITVVSLIGSAVFCYFSIHLPTEKSPMPNYYTAEAVILVQGSAQDALSASILSSLGIRPGSTTASTTYDEGTLLLMIMRSRLFLDKVIEEREIATRFKVKEPMKTSSRSLLLAKTKTTYDKNSGMISIAFTDTDPVFARDVTNTMVNVLNDWYVQNKGSSKQKELLEEKVKDVKAEIMTLETRLKTLQNKYGVLTVQELGTSQSSVLAELRSRLILKEIDIKNYATFSSIEDPRLQQLKEERQNLIDLINKFQSNMTVVQGKTTQEMNLPDAQMEFNNLTVELDTQRQIYETLSHQYEVIKLTSGTEQTLNILELAEVPDVKAGPKRSMIVIEATMAGLIAGIAISFLLYNLSLVRIRARKNATLVKESV
jgi:tyrosine-protein kinase Etk/Wzc